VKVSSQKVGESEFIFAGYARKNELTPHFIEKILVKVRYYIIFAQRLSYTLPSVDARISAPGSR
jgi:hypothetical protein